MTQMTTVDMIKKSERSLLSFGDKYNLLPLIPFNSEWDNAMQI